MKKRLISIILFLNVIFVFGTVQMGIIDEVIWIVGDEAIFRSEVEEQRLRAQHEGVNFDGDPLCIIPEQLAIQRLFLTQAAIDSVEVSESMVMSQVEHQLNWFIAQIGSRERLEEYFNKSFTEIRNELRETVRNQMIVQQVQQSLVGNINPTPAQVRRFYNSLPQDSIPIVPTQVEIQIISIEPPIPLEETNRVKDRLREFTERVHSGTANFSILARMHSECESAQRGGELGFMGRGQLVPEFAAVAFNLHDPARVSRVVETEFGFHIIQLIERRGERINTRHILMRPRVSSEDRNRAMQNMDSVANLIRTNRITFEQAVLHFSQDRNTALNAGLMLNQRTGTSRFEFQHLPAEVARVVYEMNIGEISRPFSMMNENNKEVIAIVRLRSRVETRTANLRDDYQLLKSMYEAQRGNEIIEDWIRRMQRETYINIDPAWMNCEFQFPGWLK